MADVEQGHAASEEKGASLDQAVLFAQALAEANAASRVLAARAARQKTLLLVDDDANTRLLVSTYLGTEGYNIVEAASGAEALKTLQDVKPNVILLDVDMPGLNGLDVCRVIRADEELKGMKIIMLTGRSDPSEQAAGLAAGADMYLTKPFRPRQLSEAIERIAR